MFTGVGAACYPSERPRRRVRADEPGGALPQTQQEAKQRHCHATTQQLSATTGRLAGERGVGIGVAPHASSMSMRAELSTPSTAPPPSKSLSITRGSVPVAIEASAALLCWPLAAGGVAAAGVAAEGRSTVRPIRKQRSSGAETIPSPADERMPGPPAAAASQAAREDSPAQHATSPETEETGKGWRWAGPMWSVHRQER